MYRVNVQGTVLSLSGESLLDLLLDMRDTCRGIITRHTGGYVVSSPQGACVLVNVSRIPEDVMA